MSDTHRIAVVGMGGVFPDADNIDTYWHNIISGKVSIGAAPESNLAPDIFIALNIIKLSIKRTKVLRNWEDGLNIWILTAGNTEFPLQFPSR